jgi:hypothetical protein
MLPIKWLADGVLFTTPNNNRRILKESSVRNKYNQRDSMHQLLHESGVMACSVHQRDDDKTIG